MLKVVNLACERDGRVLFSEISFILSPGATLQVQGLNGAGKTTLLRIITGLYYEYQGDIFWDRQLMKKNHKSFCLNHYFLGHRSGIKPELTPIENLIWRHQLSGRTATMHCIEALAQVNLSGYEYAPCHQLSAGQCRRVALASLLISHAPLWILDEPFTAIDSIGMQWLEHAIKKHCLKKGMVLITSHHILPKNLKHKTFTLGDDYHKTYLRQQQEVGYDNL